MGARHEATAETRMTDADEMLAIATAFVDRVAAIDNGTANTSGVLWALVLEARETKREITRLRYLSFPDVRK